MKRGLPSSLASRMRKSEVNPACEGTFTQDVWKVEQQRRKQTVIGPIGAGSETEGWYFPGFLRPVHAHPLGRHSQPPSPFYLHSSLPSLLRLHPSFSCISLLAALFPPRLVVSNAPPPWLPLPAPFSPSVPPLRYPAGALVRAAYSPDRHRGQGNGGASLSSTQWRSKNNPNRIRRDQTALSPASGLRWRASTY